jgi:hypothetical protein
MAEQESHKMGVVITLIRQCAYVCACYLISFVSQAYSSPDLNDFTRQWLRYSKLQSIDEWFPYILQRQQFIKLIYEWRNRNPTKWELTRVFRKAKKFLIY